mmetsp:Transcript_14340/g.46676  ORF Transcript_14340/g.46676 Transcript_14340/m.46676 type:complete len:298 (+) Transcript_14340:238-1131(+)
MPVVRHRPLSGLADRLGHEVAAARGRLPHLLDLCRHLSTDDARGHAHGHAAGAAAAAAAAVCLRARLARRGRRRQQRPLRWGGGRGRRLLGGKHARHRDSKHPAGGVLSDWEEGRRDREAAGHTQLQDPDREGAIGGGAVAQGVRHVAHLARQLRALRRRHRKEDGGVYGAAGAKERSAQLPSPAGRGRRLLRRLQLRRHGRRHGRRHQCGHEHDGQPRLRGPGHGQRRRHDGPHELRARRDGRWLCLRDGRWRWLLRLVNGRWGGDDQTTHRHAGDDAGDAERRRDERGRDAGRRL